MSQRGPFWNSSSNMRGAPAASVMIGASSANRTKLDCELLELETSCQSLEVVHLTVLNIEMNEDDILVMNNRLDTRDFVLRILAKYDLLAGGTDPFLWDDLLSTERAVHLALRVLVELHVGEQAHHTTVRNVKHTIADRTAISVEIDYRAAVRAFDPHPAHPD